MGATLLLLAALAQPAPPVKAEPLHPEARPAVIRPAPAAPVGDRKRRRFHRPACNQATALPQDRRLPFADRAAALKAGYRACPDCRP